MKQYLVFTLFFSAISCFAQEYRGGEFHFTRVDEATYDVYVDLYYQNLGNIFKDSVTVTAGDGNKKTAHLIANDSITPMVRRLRYYTPYTLVTPNSIFVFRTVDTIFLPELVNLDGPDKAFYSLQCPLQPPNYQFFDLNSPPLFSQPPTDYHFDQGQLIFDSGAIDPDGDTLFYGLIDYNVSDHYIYTLPAASDTFQLGFLDGLLIWNKPIQPGKYLVGVFVSSYNLSAYYLGQSWRDIIFEVTEADLVSARHQPNTAPNAFRVYPNPAAKQVNLALSAPLEHADVLQAWNMQGELVWSGHPAATVSSFSIDVHDWTPGGYCFLLQAQGRSYAQQVVVRR